MKIVDPLADLQWETKLRYWSEATVFHTTAWYRVLRDSYGFRSLALCDFNDVGFNALLPIMEVNSIFTGCRAVSLPFSDYCEPYLPDIQKGHQVIEALSPIAKERGWKSWEIRGGDRLFGKFPPAAVFSLHTIDLSLPEEALLRSFKENVRRNIRKAHREGVAISCDSSPASVKQFYRLHCLTRREHGLPPQPLAFFQNVQENILSKGLGNLFLAKFKEQTVAGAIYFHFGRKALFKYGASDRSLLSLRPNDLVMWEAIRWYLGQGFRQMCLGRTELSHYGLRRFKDKWGAVERTINYYRYEFDKGKFAQATQYTGWKLSSLVMSHLPLFLNRMLGKLLYRHVA